MKKAIKLINENLDVILISTQTQSLVDAMPIIDNEEDHRWLEEEFGLTYSDLSELVKTNKVALTLD